VCSVRWRSHSSLQTAALKRYTTHALSKPAIRLNLRAKFYLRQMLALICARPRDGLFIAQRHDGVDARGAMSLNVAGQQSNQS